MQLVLEIKNPTELQLLLQYVKLLSSVKVIDSIPAETAHPVEPSFFKKHYGSIRSNLTDKETELQLKQLREEWERDTC